MNLIRKALNFVLNLRDYQRIGIGLSRGGAASSLRRIDLTRPNSWEFSGFSQNGEDGILEVLRRFLKKPDFYFIEIGSANGLENNSAWLAFAEKYNGLMIEGDRKMAARASYLVSSFCVGVEFVSMFVDQENASNLVNSALVTNPDVFSLDIDGNDYYIAKALLDAGLKPKILVLEYNSVFGPEMNATVVYKNDFDFRCAHQSELYYGVSITAWRSFLEKMGYRFVTVDKNGVNAFFVDPEAIDEEFIANVRGLDFAENFYQLKKFRKPSSEQFRMIEKEKFVSV